MDAVIGSEIPLPSLPTPDPSPWNPIFASILEPNPLVCASKAPANAYGKAVMKRCMELGLSVNIAALEGMTSIFRIAPPLTVSEAEIDEAIGLMDRALAEC